MKRVMAIVAAIILITHSANAAFTKLDTTGQTQASASAQTSIFTGENFSPKAYEQLTGHHLNFVQRLAFKLFQKQWQRKFEKDTTGKRFRVGGFFASFLSGIAGFILLALLGLGSYFFIISIGGLFASIAVALIVSKGGENKEVFRSALIGVLAYVLVVAALLIWLISIFSNWGD